MREHTGESREWSLYWTARDKPVPCRLLPVLAGWADLDERQSTADIEPGHPILTDPRFRIDPVLARFLARSRFTWLAEGTREAYAKDYRLSFSYLWQRGKHWHEADPDDLLDWESWRLRGPQPGRRISGSKWQRNLATGCLYLADISASRLLLEQMGIAAPVMFRSAPVVRLLDTVGDR